MTTIHTHGRCPTPMAPPRPEYPKCCIMTFWYCGRTDCVHTSYADAQRHIDTDRITQNERTK